MAAVVWPLQQPISTALLPGFTTIGISARLREACIRDGSVRTQPQAHSRPGWYMAGVQRATRRRLLRIYMALYPRYTRVIGTHLLVRHCLCYDDARASCFCLCLLALAREWRSACRLHIDAAPSLSPAAADRRTRGGVGTSLSSPEQRVFPLPRGLTGTLMVDHPRSLLLAGARATCSFVSRSSGWIRMRTDRDSCCTRSTGRSFTGVVSLCQCDTSRSRGAPRATVETGMWKHV